jgi:hypothetical protein
MLLGTSVYEVRLHTEFLSPAVNCRHMKERDLLTDVDIYGRIVIR